ncbi:MAG: hypothetical protein WC043_02140 [Pseudobdellovibrionaceae bacterium]
MSKKTLFALKIFAALIFIIASFFLMGPDLRFGPDFRLDGKVIDPKSAKFDPQQFLFEDYNSYKDLWVVLRRMFPQGTERKYVESILLKQKNFVSAKEKFIDPAKRTKDTPNEVTYTFSDYAYQNAGSFCHGKNEDKREKIIVNYDSQDKVQFFYQWNSCMLFFSEVDEEGATKNIEPQQELTPFQKLLNEKPTK